MKNIYQKPTTKLFEINIEELLQIPGASQVDNDGDGISDTYPVILSDPPGGIGAKHNNMWEDWDDENSGW